MGAHLLCREAVRQQPIPFDVLSLAPVRLWDVHALGLADAASISSLTDRSGNAGHLAQATAGARPTNRANAINGQAAAEFDANDTLTGTTPAAMTAAHLFVVVKTNADPGPGYGLTGMEGAASASGHFPYADGTIYEGAFTTSRKTVGNPTPALTSWRVYEVRSAASDYQVKLDGTSLFSTATNTFASPASLTLGQNKDGIWLAGHVAYMVLFDRALSTGDALTVRSYLGTRYAITVV